MDEHRLWILMSRKLTGEATEEEIRQLDEWLKTDPQAMYSYQVFLQLWQSDALSIPPEELAQKYQQQQARIQQYHTRKSFSVQPKLRKQLWRKVMVAAAMIGGLALGFWWMHTFKHEHSSPSADVWATLSTPYGMRAYVVLPDSTQVWLNAGSKISYRKDIATAHLREINLSGEAYFEVEHRVQQPMVIHTQHLDVHDLGTAFNLRAYPGDPVTEATLIQGSIEIVNRNHPEEKILLQPSQRITFYHDSLMLQTSSSAPSNTATPHEAKNYVLTRVKPDLKENLIPDTAWKVNKLVFQSERFDELTRQLERWYNVHIVLTSKRVAAYKLTGSFENESIEQALKALQITAPFQYHMKNDTIWIDKP